MNKKELTEQEIRSRYILPALLEAGWSPDQIGEERRFTDGRMHLDGTRGKASRVDYLLSYHNIPLAVIEAKDNAHPIGGGMQQALRYAELLDVPFAYSSNGDGFLEHDRLGKSALIERELPLHRFPTPEELWSRYTAAKALTPQQEAVITTSYYRQRGGHSPRYYQQVAINRTVTAIAQGQKRVLLVMATGTGKTYTVSQIIYRLRKGGLARRVLFLADRDALINQTKTGDFKLFGEVMTRITGRIIDKSYELYLALYQGVSGSAEWQNVYRQFSPDFFDLVVIDECHRGSAAADSAWREVLDYFTTAAQIGLTATPKETRYVSNIDYFGEPIYTYSLRQGIEDGFLAPYKVIRIDVDKDKEGWIPAPGQTDKYGNIIEAREYNILDWDRSLVIEQRNQLVAERTADYMRATDPYGKTIVFCVDIAHAERMRQYLVNAIGEEAAANRRFVVRITGDSPEGKQEIENFSAVEERFPVIATTSKLLTTGVDIPTCKLIVLDTIINSMTEFKQIIGRGTRLRPDQGKNYFTIIDFRNATRLFFDPEFDGEPVQSIEYDGSGQIDFTPELESEDTEEQESGAAEERVQYVVDDVPVRIVAERVEYYEPGGRLVTKSFTEFSAENVRREYRTLDAFLQSWSAAERKKEILVELIRRGVLLDELAAQVGRDYDPFDLICHVAYDRPPLTRRQRAQAVQQQDLFTQYGETARQVLAALLHKYADSGIEALEEAADSQTMRKALQLEPLNRLGTPMEIVQSFGGPAAYIAAVRQLEQALYMVH